MDLLLRLPSPSPPRAASSSLNPLVPFAGITTLSVRTPRPSPPPFPRLAARASSSSSPVAAASPSAQIREVLSASSCLKWMVVMEGRPNYASKTEVVDYFVETLAGVLGTVKEAQACMYDVSWQTHYGFCCEIDEEASRQLAGMPGVLSVMPDKDPESKEKDYGYTNLLLGQQPKPSTTVSRFTPLEGNEYWLVQIDHPGVEVVTKAQMVDYYAQTLMKVLGNEKDAQVCIYHISWEKDYGFCCQIDEECAEELADIPGVSSVRPDTKFESDNKDYRGDGNVQKLETNQLPDVKTTRLFVTGLSFYTSEKTLRAAFEGYGELVEVKVIMDKISKRSKGYAFIEYTTEEAAAAALKEMNGKIINGWMIVVDVAKSNPPKYGRLWRQPSGSSTS